MAHKVEYNGDLINLDISHDGGAENETRENRDA